MSRGYCFTLQLDSMIYQEINHSWERMDLLMSGRWQVYSEDVTSDRYVPDKHTWKSPNKKTSLQRLNNSDLCFRCRSWQGQKSLMVSLPHPQVITTWKYSSLWKWDCGAISNLFWNPSGELVTLWVWGYSTVNTRVTATSPHHLLPIDHCMPVILVWVPMTKKEFGWLAHWEGPVM